MVSSELVSLSPSCCRLSSDFFHSTGSYLCFYLALQKSPKLPPCLLYPILSISSIEDWGLRAGSVAESLKACTGIAELPHTMREPHFNGEGQRTHWKRSLLLPCAIHYWMIRSSISVIPTEEKFRETEQKLFLTHHPHSCGD